MKPFFTFLLGLIFLYNTSIAQTNPCPASVGTNVLFESHAYGMEAAAGTFYYMPTGDSIDQPIYSYNQTTGVKKKFTTTDWPRRTHVRAFGNYTTWLEYHPGYSSADIYLSNGTTTTKIAEDTRLTIVPVLSSTALYWQGPTSTDGIEFFKCALANPIVKQVTNDDYDKYDLSVYGNNFIYKKYEYTAAGIVQSIVLNKAGVSTNINLDNGFYGTELYGNYIVYMHLTNQSPYIASLKCYNTVNGTTANIFSTTIPDTVNPTDRSIYGFAIMGAATAPKIIFSGYDGDDYEVYQYNLGTATLTQVTNNSGVDDLNVKTSGKYFSWYQDGKMYVSNGTIAKLAGDFSCHLMYDYTLSGPNVYYTAQIDDGAGYYYSTIFTGSAFRPSITKPVANATNVVTTPSVTCTTHPGSTASTNYTVEISTSSTDWSSALTQTKPYPSAPYNFSGLLYNTQYFVRAKAATMYEGLNGDASSFTTEAYPRTKVISPAAGTTNFPISGTVTCLQKDQAIAYHWQLATNSTFTAGVINHSTTSNVLNLSDLTLSLNKRYYVRVKVEIAQAGISQVYCPSSYFTTSASARMGFIETHEMLINTYPNPTIDIVNIEADYTSGSVKLFNIQGRELATEVLENERTIQLNLSYHPKGLYLIKFVDNKGDLQTVKVNKQ